MGPKKGPVATLTPSTPTPDTPRAMRNKARSQSVQTDSTSSTDPPEVLISRKRAKTTATPHIVWKYTWPSFQGKMKKKLRTLHAEWSGEEIRTEISGRWKKYKEDGTLGEGVDKLEDTDEEKVVEEKDDGETESE